MQCLILAGGLGTRMRTITGTWPKALLPVGNETFLDVQLKWLKLLGVTDVVLALGFGGEEIMRHLEAHQFDKAYPQVNYSFDTDVPKDISQFEGANSAKSAAQTSASKALLGTGGAIRKASSMLSKDFIVTYGDSFVFIKIKDMIKQHEASGKPLTVSIFHNRNQGDKSNILYKDGKLLKYDKINPTPEMEYVDYGLSVVNKDYFMKHTSDGRSDFADFISKTIARGDAEAYVPNRIFEEVGSPEGYIRFVALFKAKSLDIVELARSEVK
jgi:N-acetyl-alpha-D-muramate 1-phosphate uridylyltransferase